MNKEDADALIGQLAADSALLRALCATLIETAPGFRAALERKVEEVALYDRQVLPPEQRTAFQTRLQELRVLFE